MIDLTYLRALWRTIRLNQRHGTLHPTSDTVTITLRRPDGRTYRVHNVPARHVDTFIEHSARRGESVLIGEETS